MEQLLTQPGFPWQFLEGLISRFGEIDWPARCPDLAVPDYYLWGYVRSKVHVTRPANTDDLKRRIRERMQGIRKGMLQGVTT